MTIEDVGRRFSSALEVPAIRAGRLANVFAAAPGFVAVMALALLATVMWLATHPYLGIYHDAIVYSLLTARWLNPSDYANDVFFLFGSQDDLNLYTPIYGALTSMLGLDVANRFVTLLGAGTWIGANSLLAYRIFGQSLPFRFVVLAAAATSISYSPNGSTFLLNEGFATARVIAMPLVLFGIGADLYKRRFLAGALLIGAVLIHPLLGVWGGLASICTRVRANYLLIGLCCGVGLIAANDMQSLSSHLAPMSREWVETIRHTSTDVLFGDISSIKIERFLWWIGVLWLGARLGNGLLRRYYLMISLVTACSCLLTLYCSYVTPVELFVQIQPWRALWLAIALGWIAIAEVVWRGVRLGRPGCVGLGFLAVSLYLASQYAWCIPVALAAGLASRFGQLLVRRLADVFVGHERACMLVLVAVSLAVFPSYLIDLEMTGLALPGEALGKGQMLRGFLLGGGYGLGFLFLSWMCGVRSGSFLVLVIGVPSLILAAMSWDTRSAETQAKEQRFLEHVGDTHPFSKSVKPGDVMAWPGHELDVWFLLRAANYASSYQAIGIVFSEKKTQEIRARLERIALAFNLTTEKSSVATSERNSAALGLSGDAHKDLRQYARDEMPIKAGAELCKDNQLNWFVSPQAANDDEAILAVATSFDKGRAQRLYSCEAFR